MLCTIDYNLSKIKPFNNDATKQYLDLVFIPKTSANNLLLAAEQANSNNGELRIQVYPKRINGNVVIEHMQALIQAFQQKQLGDQYVSKYIVPIKACHMTYMTTNAAANQIAGQLIMDSNGQPKVFTSVTITALSIINPTTGVEEPAIGMDLLIRRAERLRESRIKAGQWKEAVAPTTNVNPLIDADVSGISVDPPF